VRLLGAIATMVLVLMFQNCGTRTTQSLFYFGGSCAPLMSRTPAASTLTTRVLDPAPLDPESAFTTVPSATDRRIWLDDFLSRSVTLANLNGGLSASSSFDSSGKLTLNGTSKSTWGLTQLDLNTGIPLPSGSKRLVLSLSVPRSDSGSIVSPLVVIHSYTTGNTSYSNLSPVSCGSTFAVCSEPADYSLTLDPGQEYELREIHFTPAGVSGRIQSYSVTLRGLAVDVAAAADRQIHASLHGPLISSRSWSGEIAFDSPEAATVTVKTAVFPFLKELLYQTPEGNLADPSRVVSATASTSRCYGSWCVPALNAILPGTLWASAVTSSPESFPAKTTFQLELDQVYAVNVFKIGIGNHGAPYEIQISEDGEAWTPVYSSPGGEEDGEVIGRMSDLTGIRENRASRLRIVYRRPTLADEAGRFGVTLSGVQLFPEVRPLANGMVPVVNVDQTRATHLQDWTVKLGPGHSVIPITVDGLGPGEYVLQTGVSDGRNVIAAPSRHLSLIRPERNASDPFFGINNEFFDSQDVFVNHLSVQASRVFVNWPGLQTASGSHQLFAWPNYDSLFQRLSAAGTRMHAVINHIPPALSGEPAGTAYSGTFPPADLLLFDASANNVDYRNTEFYKFVKAFTTAYRPWLSTVEIMNEFDINSCVSWKNWQGSFAGTYYDCSDGGSGVQGRHTFSAGSLANRSGEYMELLRAGYLAVKDVDPSIRVTHAGLASIDEQTIRNLANYVYYDGHKGSEFFDVYNFHQYWANQAPEFSRVNSNSGGGALPAPFEEFLAGILGVVRGEFHKEALMTEFGFDDRFGGYTSGGLAPPSTRKEQAVFNSRALVLFKKAGIRQAFPFEAIDLWSGTSFFGGMGLIDLEGQGKDWLSAYQLMNEQFSGFSHVRTIERAPHRIEVFQNASGIVRAFVFKKDPAAPSDGIRLSSGDLGGAGIIRRVTPLLNDLDSDQAASEVTLRVPYLNPVVVEAGPGVCN